ncbi:MAG: hypothetical protein RSB10_05735, partial [Clostridia bacterium]
MQKQEHKLAITKSVTCYSENAKKDNKKRNLQRQEHKLVFANIIYNQQLPQGRRRLYVGLVGVL